MSTFHVPDITCNACIRALTSAAREIDDRATLQVDLATKQVKVTSTAPRDAVARAFREAGFTVEPA